MKVVLIEAGEKRIINVFQKFKLPRLGLPILGKILKNLGHEVTIYCEDITPLNWQETDSADLIGISALTPTATRAYEIIQQLTHRRRTHLPIVMGGPHVTFLPEEALQNGANFVVRGEGEKTMVELVQWLEDHSEKPIEKILGLSYRIGNKILHNPPRLPLSSEELDLLPFPDLSLIRGYKTNGINLVLTSRGCPFDCRFCSVTKMFGRKYRFRSVENVIGELEGLFYQFPHSEILFYDDNLTVNPKRAKKLLREMIARQLTFHWSAQVRVEVGKDLELLELMKESGCEWLYLGLESVNPQTLKDFRKEQTVENIEENIEIIHRFGIRVLGMFIIGGETDDSLTAPKTITFAKRMDLDAIQLWLLTPLPGTEIYEELEKANRLLYSGPEKWHLYDGNHVVFRPKKMSPLELQYSVFKAFPKFYSTWRWVKKLLNLIAKFPFSSGKSKRVSFEKFAIALYFQRFVSKIQNSKPFKKYLQGLKEIRD